MLQHQHMQLEPRLMERIGQDGKYFLLNLHKVCPVELVTEVRFLSQFGRDMLNQAHIISQTNGAISETTNKMREKFQNLKVFQHLEQKIEPSFSDISFGMPKCPDN